MIESYNFGKIVIDGKGYTDDVIVFPDRVKDGWWREEGHSLNPKDLEEVMRAEPDVLIVGTGAYGRMSVPPGTREFIESEGIELIVEKTEKACDSYNKVSGEKTAIAALHLTC